MTGRLSQQRCFNHQQREAAARCLECDRYFCRECITEHEDRLLCSTCLRDSTASKKKRFTFIGGPVRFLQFVCGLAILWFIFYNLGDLLLKLPSAFHEGTLWFSGWGAN